MAMRHVMTLFMYIGFQAAVGALQPCEEDGQCGTEGSVSLLQSKYEIVKTASGSIEASGDRASANSHINPDGKSQQYSYGPYRNPRPVIEYFKKWAEGSVANSLARILHEPKDGEGLSLAQTDMMSAEQAVASLKAIREEQCPEQAHADDLQHVVLTAEAADADGIRHTLLKRQDGQIQYLAVHTSEDGIERAMVADPPACHKYGVFVELEQGPLKPARPRTSGAPVFAKLDDDVVKDCKKLFLRTANDVCHKKFAIEVKQAVVSVTDGTSVRMVATLRGPAGKITHHSPECVFEKDEDRHDAKLLQQPDVALRDPTEEEKKGNVATLKLYVPLCDADAKDDESDAAALVQALSQHGLGSDIKYKGNEWIKDALPAWNASVLQVAEKANVDLRSEYPACFPALAGKTKGTETVRNQGTCGSCWAFAAASTTMESLCISDGGSTDALFSPSDRYEVSVQKMISCSTDGTPSGKAQRGCNGGNVWAADVAFKNWGITKERDNMYKCGGGDAHKHFTQKDKTCEAYPWNGKCSGQPDPNYLWGGAVKMKGAPAMKAALSGGHAMVAGIRCFQSFMDQNNWDILTREYGKNLGGHDINLVGYGTDDEPFTGSTSYWIVQNSWGTGGYGVGGYGRVKLGVNLLGIEEDAYTVRAWIKGGTEPPCADSESSGLSHNGMAPYLSCSAVANYCTDPGLGPGHLDKYCMKTCGKCGNRINIKTTVGPSPPPPPPPPPPPAAPTTCKNSDWYRDPSFKWSCTTWNGYVCKKSYSFISDLEKYCPLACKQCLPKQCKDDPHYKDPTYGDNCVNWQGYNCGGMSISAELMKKCPGACEAKVDGVQCASWMWAKQ